MLGPYRVLDLTDEKGLICGKTLGDLGADVIKIEPPGGHECRDLGPFFRDVPSGEESLYWFAYNANKRSITLNLESAEGQDMFRRLAAKADFVIESFVPGYLERLGIGYSALSQINPRVILTYQKRDGVSFRQSMRVASFSSDNASLTWPDSSVCRPLEWSSRQVI